MLNELIIEKINQFSYSSEERANIDASLEHLKGIIDDLPDFTESFIGGSYKRDTMVKGISDIDIYTQYTGNGNAQAALDKLKQNLKGIYPDADIRPDKPSVLIKLKRIPFDITPYKKDRSGVVMIGNKTLSVWNQTNLKDLETAIKDLRNKNPQYISLIKILKIWNKNYPGKWDNFKIEERVYNLFRHEIDHKRDITSMMQVFFKFYNLHNDSVAMVDLIGMSKQGNNQLKTKWNNYIENNNGKNGK